jgi:hypothetical protein
MQKCRHSAARFVEMFESNFATGRDISWQDFNLTRSNSRVARPSLTTPNLLSTAPIMSGQSYDPEGREQ